MDNQNKIPYVFAIVLIASIIGGIWIFGFDDELFGSSYNTAKPTWYSEESSVKQENQIIVPDTPQTEQITKETPESHSNIPSVSENSVQSQQVEKDFTIVKPKTTKPLTKDDVIKNLEKHDFILEGNGKGYQGTPANSKAASVSMVLTPIPGSSLTKFQIKTGKLIYDAYGINMDDGVLEISNDKVTITLSQDSYLDPIATFVGIFSGSILDEKPKEHSIHFENQPLYLGKETKAPLHFTLDSVFSSQ